MSGRANLCRTTDHWVTVWSGYCPIGLLSCWVTVSKATYYPLGYCPVRLLSTGELSVGLVSGQASVRESF